MPRLIRRSRIQILFGLSLILLATSSASALPRTRMYFPQDELLMIPSETRESPGAVSNPLFQFLGTAFNPFVQPGAEQIVEKYFTQKLNPADSADLRTFQQRYFVYSKHASGPKAPVIYFICGEFECTPQHFIGRFAETAAETLNAHLVALEHRYYGKSVPFEILTPESLAYLSTENALKDLASFQRYAKQEFEFKGKWISMGGSYPGSLSAYYRLKYPELVVGALASSAPVQARNAFEEYDSHVTQVVGPVCAAALRQISAEAEKALANPKDFLKFKARFNASEIKNDRDFLYVLADITADAVQYGYPESLCSTLASNESPLAAYALYVREFFAARGLTAVEFSPEIAGKLKPSPSDNMRQWYYQSCKEYGYWQDAHHNPKLSVRSSRLNADYNRDLCSRFFGITELANESEINKNFYEPLLNPANTTRILFTNGSKDPWSELSITLARQNDVNPETSVYLLEGAAHCADLGRVREWDSVSLQQGRKLFLNLATEWLK